MDSYIDILVCFCFLDIIVYVKCIDFEDEYYEVLCKMEE